MVTVRPGSDHRRGSRRKVRRIKAAQQLLAAFVAFEAAAPLGVHLHGQGVAADGEVVGGDFRGLDAARQHLLCFAHTGCRRAGLCDRCAEDHRDQ
jgi:hypothetical protein